VFGVFVFLVERSFGPLTEKSFDVSGPMKHPKNLDTIHKWAVKNQIPLKAPHRPGADRREARIAEGSLRT
jgi:hypothetical protein